MELTVVSVSDDGGVLRIKAANRVTEGGSLRDSDAMASLLGAEGYARRVALDLSEVTYIDSTGISWLLVRHKRFCEAGGKLVMHSIPSMVQNVLKILRLDLVFDMADNESAAVTLAAKQASWTTIDGGAMGGLSALADRIWPHVPWRRCGVVADERD